MSNLRINFLFNSALTVLNALFPIVVFSYSSKLMGPEYIGKAQFIISVMQYFILIAALGIPFYGVREVARVKHQKEDLSKCVSEVLSIHIITSLLLLIIYVFLISRLPFFANDKQYYLLSSINVILGFCAVDWFFSGIQNFKFIAIRSLITKVISFVLLLLLVNSARDFFWYIEVLIFSTLANNVWNLFSIRKYVDINFTIKGLKKHIKPLFLIFGTTIALSLYQLFDTIILGLLSDNHTVGLYTVAVKLNKVVLPFVVSLGTVLIPKIAEQIEAKNFIALNLLVDKSFKFIVLISCLATLFIFFFSKNFILLLSGSAFSDSTISAQIMSPLCIIIGLSNIYGLQILTSAQKDKQVLISVLAGVIVSILLNYLLVPHFSHVGASIANIICEVFVTAIAFFYAHKFFKIGFNYVYFAQILVGCFLVSPVMWICMKYLENIFVQMFISSLVTLFFFFILQLYVFRNIFIIELYKQLPLLKNRIRKA